MSTPANEPGGLKTAFALALVTAMAAGALLYQANRTPGPTNFSRGGRFADLNRGRQDLSLSTPGATPLSTAASHSAAVLTAPNDERTNSAASGGQVFPPLGHYIYKVDGTESATAFGSRTYPPEMTMTVQQKTDDTQKLESDEMVFDLVFSSDHKEREIVAYRRPGVYFTFEGGSVTFGPGFTRTSDASYDPPMLQIPTRLKAGDVFKGKSTATAADGTTSRIEDWTVTVKRRDKLDVLGRTFDTWVVKIQRDSEPGSSETVHRTRTYWFSPEGRIWLKWIEDFNGSQNFGPGTFNYTTHFTATLDRVEPL